MRPRSSWPGRGGRSRATATCFASPPRPSASSWYLFDPYLALSTSLIEPLPHQITAVHGEMLPRQPFRFLLADDPGAGKTIMAAPQAELGRLLFDGAAEADPHASVVWRQWPPPEPNHYDVPDQPGRLCRLGSLCVSTCMQLAGLTAGHAPRPAIARARQRHFGGAVDAW
jgi:hypothetical protein